MKRVVVISDLHCGHRAGLTPPIYQYREGDGERGKFSVIQKTMWDWYTKKLESLQPIHMLIVNGDAIEGKGDRSGGTEIIEADREKQVDMAIDCIGAAKAEKKVVIYGTPYHTGTEEDWEAVLAKLVGADIKSRAFVNCEGVTFDVKHKVAGSIVPYGRYTAPARERIWNLVWAERGMAPKANIFIRSHVHYLTFAGDSRNLTITSPCLQGPGSKYGARQCSGTIDIGVLSFDCYEENKYNFEHHLLDMTFLAEEAIEV